MARTGQPATRQVAVVQRAVTILGELADARTELGTNEIARRTGINASTVSRLLSTLVAGVYWIVRAVTGWTLDEQTDEVVRTILVIVNVLPLLACFADGAPNGVEQATRRRERRACAVA